MLRAGLRLLLGAQSDMNVVGEAADGVEAYEKARELQPDVVLLDVSMPGPHSGGVIREIQRVSPTTRVLILTMHDDAAYLRSALSAGAAGYLVKRAADAELMTAIRAVHAGRTFVDVTELRHRPVYPARENGLEHWQPPKNLSRREREVLRLLAQGNSNQQIAEKFRVSVKTIETYRARLSEKLGLKGRSD